MRPTAWAFLSLGLLGCGGEDPTHILVRWTTAAEGALVAPGEGPDRRILLAERETGAVQTLESVNGRTLEGPFLLFPTLQAPVALGADLYLISSIGRIVRANLAGETLPSPTSALGRSSPLVVGTDGALRVATTAGRLLIIAGEEVRADVALDGAAESAPAVASDGSTYVATDLGQLLGVSGNGQSLFTVAVHGPASGPSTNEARIAVGELDGVSVFEKSGTLAWRAARAARVVGTLFDGEEVLAYGEDGKLERYDANGNLISSFSAGPPIYGPVLSLPTGKVAVFDSTGKVHRVTREGTAEATFDLGAEPTRQAARTEIGFVVITVGSEAKALDFEAQL